MKLPTLKDTDVQGKRVIVRLDLDVPKDDDTRLSKALPTLTHLARAQAKIVVIGHLGRPGGHNKKFSLEPVAKRLEKLLKKELSEEEFENLDMQMMENLRFDEREKENDTHYVKHLAEKGEVYINESFANSHRKDASIVGLPKLLPHAAGIRLVKEVEMISKVLEKPKHPVVVILGGVKKDKITYIKNINKMADRILVGGKLPDYLGDPDEIKDSKLVVARLLPDKEDITLHSMEKFVSETEKAGTIVVVGPMGKYEDAGHTQGTKMVFEAVANSSAFKMAGGGDTEKAIGKLGLTDKFDWISVGGGALLEFLATGTLVGVEALAK